MSMYNSYDYEVKAVHPSGLPQFQSGRMSSSRRFLVPCENAEDFALRMMGKFYLDDGPDFFDKPLLAAPYPFDPAFDGTSERSVGLVNLIASSFAIEAVSGCCFQVERFGESDVTSDTITDPTSHTQMERYYSKEPDADNSECLCFVDIGYSENPCDCAQFDYDTGQWVVNDEILPGTCVSVERNPAYEMFTLPNAGLVWKNIYDSQGDQVQLKADSYAYKIIPKADIIVHWHNVPVKRLCQIESHLASFRGTVNQEEWGNSILCILDDPFNLPGDDKVDCLLYEPETILFVDWQEDRSMRTDSFGGTTADGNNNMNTTTLKLVFKQKRIEIDFGASGSNASVSDDDAGIAGWNHLFTDNDIEQNTWMRVVVKSNQQPIFPLRAFSDIFYPVL